MSRDCAVVVGKDVHATLPGVLDEIRRNQPDLPIFVVDDGSDPALAAPGVTLLRHPRNRGYGAAQKTGYAAAMAAGHQRIALVHGDGQYAVGAVLGLLEALDDAEMVLGSRFLVDGGRTIPGWRRLGNRLLTGLGNLSLGTALSEMHTGARAFRAEALRGLDLGAFSDDYLFDQQVIAAIARTGGRIAERPVPVRYDDTVQSISFRRSVRYGLGCVATLVPWARAV